MRDKPIEEHDIPGNVVNIGDLRVGKGLTRRPSISCAHRRLSYDLNERRIWCRDCERDIDAFEAFMYLVENYNKSIKDLQRREKEIQKAESQNLKRRAAREIDKVWQQRNMLPACPECGSGLFPEDFAEGMIGGVGREYAIARRNAKRKRP